MKLRKLSAATAMLASGALILTACTPGDDGNGGNGDGGNGDATETQNGENGGDAEAGVEEGTGGEFDQEGALYSTIPDSGAKAEMPEGFETNGDTIISSPGAVPFINVNNDEAGANSTGNSIVSDRMSSGFMYFGSDLSIVENEEFGSYEVLSEDPLTVEYTINEEAVWSDGTAITALDYQLGWAGQAYADTEESPGAGFNPSGSSLADYVPDGFQAEAPDAKTFTMELPEYYADWQLLVSGPGVPAHIVAQESDMSVDELSTAIQEGDLEALEPVAEVWNEGLGYAGEWDPEIALSSGPYQLAEWNWQGEESGGSVTLEPNPEWWGTPPGTETLIFQFVDESTHVQALENQDINVIEPQADEDVKLALDDLAETGDVVVHEGDIASWEHIDFQYQQGPFAETPELAEAFALCLPRQEIVEQLIQPVYEEAEVLNAREVLSFQEGYDDFVAESYDGRYDGADVEGAAEIIEANDAVGTTIDINHFGQPRRAAAVEIINTYCGAEGAGFDIQDAGDPAFSAELLEGNWSGVAMFAWAGSGQIVSGQNIYSSDGQQNATGYSNETVDEQWDVIAGNISDEERTQALIEMEQALWDDLHGIPLYTHPGVVAHDSSIANVRMTAAQTQVQWNAEQWQRAE
ncbi:ABC transporter substrate-binding protein [Garicola koreensis]|uniref:Peptide/nickel transport system substrate-binding protein n=1 Tax=Garicola koreensis TaxID=1262554 RepID=A0A7W5TTV7_9MICC|nr:ABC transporter substrate-binding protein [Garicola koreensis]MBB3667683.1 peptide/nickel transport system substrate-binding protein [Garicola koreensis]